MLGTLLQIWTNVLHSTATALGYKRKFENRGYDWFIEYHKDGEIHDPAQGKTTNIYKQGYEEPVAVKWDGFTAKATRTELASELEDATVGADLLNTTGWNLTKIMMAASLLANVVTVSMLMVLLVIL